MEKLIAGKYRVDKKIGAGSFGEIYLGIDKNNSE
jgi:serine/threonine protein kinase